METAMASAFMTCSFRGSNGLSVWGASVRSRRAPRPGPPARSARAESVSSASPASASSRRRLRMHGARLVDRRPADLLLEAWPLALLVGRELHRLPGLRRAVQRADHAHVGKALVGAGLRIVVLQHAVGEVEQLGRELVALRE